MRKEQEPVVGLEKLEDWIGSLMETIVCRKNRFGEGESEAPIRHPCRDTE